MPWFIGRRKDDDDYTLGIAEAHMRRAGRSDEEIQRMKEEVRKAGTGKAAEVIENYVDLG